MAVIDDTVYQGCLLRERVDLQHSHAVNGYSSRRPLVGVVLLIV